MARKLRVLLDSSVILSALFSSTGASALILKLAEQKKINLLIHEYIVEEVESVLVRKSPENIGNFIALISKNLFRKVKRPTAKEVALAETIITDPKDAPILASAIREKVDYLITLDRRDFLNISLTRKGLGPKIVLPGTLIKDLGQHHPTGRGILAGD